MSLTKGKIIGNYRVLDELGKGSIGCSYLAEETIMGFRAVLRDTNITVNPEETADRDLIESLKSLSALKHLYICGFKTAFVNGGRLFLVGDYTPERTLEAILEEQERIPEERALKIGRQIIDALMYAHREGIFHGRLKASKIHLGADDAVKIRDFGIAGVMWPRLYMEDGQNQDMGQTVKIGMSGTELDIYSCGLLLYRMLTGKRPFAEERDFYRMLMDGQMPPDFTIPAEDKLSAKASELITNMSTVTKPPCKLLTAKEIILRRQEQNVAMENATAAVRKFDLSPIELVKVEGGVFKMGDHFHDGDKDELPEHLVKLYPFHIAKYPLTQKEWTEVMGYNPSFYKGDNLPVESVSWLEAVMYCNKRSLMEGLVPCYSLDGDPEPHDWSHGTVYCRFSANGYRLPTEAEWEYAARGGKKSIGYRFAGSNNVMEVAWYRDNSGRKPQPVGLKKPNELGIHDMSGNVWEWCWDWYDAKFYTPKPVLNPVGPDHGVNRVLRGGSFTYQSKFMRVSCRHHFGPNVRYDGNGFRLVRSYL